MEPIVEQQESQEPQVAAAAAMGAAAKGDISPRQAAPREYRVGETVKYKVWEVNIQNVSKTVFGLIYTIHHPGAEMEVSQEVLSPIE